jgi:hypothetical protein
LADVTLAGESESVLRLGPVDEPPAATLSTDPATLIRLCAGRSPDPAGFVLTGASPSDYLIFN